MSLIDVVVFEMNGTYYALDINLTREIVEFMEITPVPRMPEYIAGILNLRGEITKIINLNKVLEIPESHTGESRKIIILTSEESGGSRMGIIVDNVRSVIQIDGDAVEHMDDAITKEAYLKGIIKQKSDSEDDRLIIWIDLEKILSDLKIS
ncbi:purine-binding chemotaxis protein CheW [Methanomicrobium sp. W14]|jgi:purine-binding chemotaxis protein CheW|uniref:chemotaxis protein CheW n=1 Tax=Methanomicrobium sp. W14 TaxID=2817839 RepID=UPI001AE80C71|nr:chemotaxis protein CheW [Methanomicrobium sp. W14]MBP2133609.1 purine-binding chemotaxis protein CheW [Methanomicrobium sp. W14]